MNHETVKADYCDGEIVCVCGEWIKTGDMEEELIFELRHTYFNNMSESKEFICPKCGALHTLKLKAHLEISVYSEVKTTGVTVYQNHDGEAFFSNQLDGYLIGDLIPLADGSYKNGRYEYIVKDGKVETIYSSIVDENQLSLDINEPKELVA